MKQKEGRCRGDWFRTNSLNAWVPLGVNEERFGRLSRSQKTPTLGLCSAIWVNVFR